MKPLICSLLISKTFQLSEISEKESDIRSDLGSDVFDAILNSAFNSAEKSEIIGFVRRYKILESDIRSELGSDVCDSLALGPHKRAEKSEIIGFALLFKTYWDSDRGVFDAVRFPPTGGFDTSFICSLSHEKADPSLRIKKSASPLRGKRVLDWGRAERLIRYVLRVVVGFSAEIAFLDSEAFTFAFSGDESYLPKSLLKNTYRRDLEGEPTLFCKLLREEVVRRIV